MPTSIETTAPKNTERMAELQGMLGTASLDLFNVTNAIRKLTEEKNALTQQIEIIKEVSSDLNRRNGLNIQETSLHTRGKFDESKLAGEEKAKFDDILSRIATIESELLSLNTSNIGYQAHINALQSEIYILSTGNDLNQILSLQEQQKQLELEICKINKIIETQQKLLKEEETKTGESFAKISSERQQILVEMAMGGEAKQLPAIPDDKNSEHICETISGLNARLEETTKKLKSLLITKSDTKKRYLTSEAEKVGKEYLSAAHTVADAMRRLIAINAILTDQYGYNIEASDYQKACLPVFALTCMKDAGSADIIALNDAACGLSFESDVKAMYQYFASLGIQDMART